MIPVDCTNNTSM